MMRSAGDAAGGAPLADALDTTDLVLCSSGDQDWRRTTSTYYNDGDSAESGPITHSESSVMTTEVEGEGTLSFYWKVSSEASFDYLQFYVDGNLQDEISGNVNWQQKSYNLTGSGTHTLKWQYVKDGSVSEGSDTGWVDYLQWSGSTGGSGDPNTWQQIEYTYDPSGRRIAKKVDGSTTVQFLYDGDHCIAEYDGSNNLLRKFIHGPAVDEPICLIEDGSTSYYHFDALGSVVALSDGSGDAAVVYEYSVYGQVSASDPNHTNPFLFTGRRFDADTGLYYYRARDYNPYIGRFLQTDPIGYRAGVHLYRYCRNNPLNYVDPSGLIETWGYFYDGRDDSV